MESAPRGVRRKSTTSGTDLRGNSPQRAASEREDPESWALREPSGDPAGGVSTGRWSLVKVAILFYGLVFGIAWAWATLADSSLFFATDAAQADGASPVSDVLVGGIAGLVAVHLSRMFTRRTRSGEVMARALGSVLGTLSVYQCFVLALSSGIAEEALFRGALQPRVGLVLASLLFGLAHFVPRRDLAVWTLTTIAAGFMLGLLFQETGNLIAPTVAHFTINALNLRWLSANYGSTQ